MERHITKRRLLIATNNPGKIKEIYALLDHLDLELISPKQLSLNIKVEENGKSYAENAALKGKAFAKTAGILTLADDSGLEVEKLNSLPGIYSARFAPQEHATDADRRSYLLDQLSGIPRPWIARFKCMVALVSPYGETAFAQGTCQGEINPKERGRNGFGYDPIFWIPELSRTMAELSMFEKNQFSHRAKAVKAAIPSILEMLNKLEEP